VSRRGAFYVFKAGAVHSPYSRSVSGRFESQVSRQEPAGSAKTRTSEEFPYVSADVSARRNEQIIWDPFRFTVD
jgi:hypothetical protein